MPDDKLTTRNIMKELWQIITDKDSQKDLKNLEKIKEKIIEGTKKY